MNLRRTQPLKGLIALLCRRLGDPAIDCDFPVCTAREEQRFLEACRCHAFRVLVFVGVGNIGERVVPDDRTGALFVSHEWPFLSFALDDVVANRDRLEVALAVESEQPFLAWWTVVRATMWLLRISTSL